MSTGALRARAAVIASRAPGGDTRLRELRSSPPLALRRAAGSVWMVGTAAGPLPGDRVVLHIEVGPGASLAVRSTAAMVALGGGGQAPSELVVEVDVGPGGELSWLPEPTIATAGCHHRSTARIGLAAGARLVWREELVLGRHGEGAGRLASRVEIEADGVAVLRQELRVGPGAEGWQGPAVIGESRAVGVVAVIRPDDQRDPPAPSGSFLGPEVAVLPLAGGGVLASAVASDASDLRRRLDAALVAGRCRGRLLQP